MATETNQVYCVKCGKEKATSKCTGCLQEFCYNHFKNHHQELNKQLDEIEVDRDVFRQTLNGQINQTNSTSIIKQIDQWVEDSIKIIQQTANECKQILSQQGTKDIYQIDVDLVKLTDQLIEMRQENDFNEIDINQFKEKLSQLVEELDRSSTAIIQQNSTPLINKISVVVSSRPRLPTYAVLEQSLSSTNMKTKTKWIRRGITIAGGNGKGNQLNQLSSPRGIYVDDDDHQTIYIADYENHRIVKWKKNAMHGQVVAGGNGQGGCITQLDRPTDVTIDKKNDSLIISDRGNNRVVRWCRRNHTNPQAIIPNIYCSRLTMDNNGDLYVSDWEKNEVRRWRQGDTTGTLVAGGNGKGDHLDQLSSPSYLFVDQDHSVYVSDYNNNRVVKWMKGARRGIVVAGGQGQGDSRTQLDHPQGVIADHFGNVYVADCWNHRIMGWQPGARKGCIVAGGNERGEDSNQFQYPVGLSFDRQGNLYVVDQSNNRVQKFDIDND